ncbi:pimeloyl-ACP methyl ester carboxylesterase [Stackebrandtia albiflava]|uniref:Pimeloyl-ACP methyl ester carboxylesterase n=1 Tax=Stackebrandtia albiflava TaxID=406432 RepID=A0A562V2B8_9ACTN|nr:alpha/beta hydrolase [Stackebrandtia albiflava]TWJ12024.1 pimeloyl-ACP methyl ester carboxylesterase [Stackebrandtia albiflava]
MVTHVDLRPSDARTLRTYHADSGGSDVIVWCHGTPNLGEPPAPLFAAAAALGLRWVSYDRPGYGGSTPTPGRDIASAAEDIARVADAAGAERFAVMGHSGGGPHALAAAALLPDRVTGVVCGAGLAPFDAAGLDWFAGMAPAGAAELRAAQRGREALREKLAASKFDPEQFTPSDHAALEGDWDWLNHVAGHGLDSGLDGMIDDDVAYVSPWGFDVAAIAAPVILLHGDADRIVPVGHAEWLAERLPSGHRMILPGEGHISVLSGATAALDRLAALTR